MANEHMIHLVGVVLTVAGSIALIASAHVFGSPQSPADKRQASDEWNRRRDTYRFPVDLEMIVSAIFFVGGIAILIWSRFELCAFLAYWLPSMPAAIRVLLSCR
jgi:hypothetical protein